MLIFYFFFQSKDRTNVRGNIFELEFIAIAKIVYNSSVRTHLFRNRFKSAIFNSLFMLHEFHFIAFAKISQHPHTHRERENQRHGIYVFKCILCANSITQRWMLCLNKIVWIISYRSCKIFGSNKWLAIIQDSETKFDRDFGSLKNKMWKKQQQQHHHQQNHSWMVLSHVVLWF